MAVVIVNKKITSKDILLAQEEYGEYIKIVCDVKSLQMGIGGLWHADIEKELLSLGCEQNNLWGGGINIKTHEIDFTSLINIRPKIDNNSMEILNTKLREKFTQIVKAKFAI